MIIKIPFIGKYELKKVRKAIPFDDEYETYEEFVYKNSNEYKLLKNAIRALLKWHSPGHIYNNFIGCGYKHYTSRKFTRALFRLTKDCPERLEIIPRRHKKKEEEVSE